MKRLVTALLAAPLLVGVLAGISVVWPDRGGATSDDVPVLQTQVAALQTEVAGLDTRVSALEGGTPAALVTLSGMQSGLTDAFAIAGGWYESRMSCDSKSGVSGSVDYYDGEDIVAVIMSESGAVEFPGGVYRAHAWCDGPWQITLRPLL